MGEPLNSRHWGAAFESRSHLRRALGGLKWSIKQPLNRGHPTRTILQWLRYESALLLAPGPIAVPFVGSSRIFASPDMSNPTNHFLSGLTELPEMMFLLHFLRPEDLFIDVGANVGAYTVLASAVVGAESIAIEPVPKTFQRLMDNIHLKETMRE